MLVLRQQLPHRCRPNSRTPLPISTVLSATSTRCKAGNAATPPPAPADGEQTLSSAKTAQQPSAEDRVLFVGGLPGVIDADTLREQIQTACEQCGQQPELIEVARFDNDSQRSRFTAGWKHKGHALVAFTSPAAVSAAAAAVKQVPGWGAQATAGHARKLPKHWNPEVTLSPEELQVQQHQQAAAAARRSHNKRQRQRQQQRLISSVDQILQALPAPGGIAVLQLYKPLLPGGWDWHAVDSSSTNSNHVHSAGQCSGHSSDASGMVSGSGDLKSDVTDCEPQTGNRSDTPVQQLLAAMPEPLRNVIIKDRLHQLLQSQQQQQQHQLIRLAAAPSVADVAQRLLFDWFKIPAVVDPAFGGQLADADVVRAGRGPMNLRSLRKRVQVESFALLLLQLTLPALQANTPLHIVEFGCGNGNLVLPLAHLFPGFQFTAVDMKHSAVQLLQQRVHEGEMTNVEVIEGTIEQYSGDADVVLALRACGAASDWSLLQARRCGAAFIVSPCCIGKVNKDNTAGLLYGKQKQLASKNSMKLQETVLAHTQESGVQTAGQQGLMECPRQEQLQYPRSQWMRKVMDRLAERVQQEQQQDTAAADSHVSGLTPLQQAAIKALEGSEERSRRIFSLLAQAADYSHQEEHGYPELAALAKSNVEFDRGRSMSEAGYDVEFVRLLQPELTAKSDVLVGARSLEPGPTRLGSASPSLARFMVGSRFHRDEQVYKSPTQHP